MMLVFRDKMWWIFAVESSLVARNYDASLCLANVINKFREYAIFQRSTVIKLNMTVLANMAPISRDEGSGVVVSSHFKITCAAGCRYPDLMPRKTMQFS